MAEIENETKTEEPAAAASERPSIDALKSELKRENNKKEARTIESEFLKHIKSLKDLGQTEAMNNHFRINEILEKGIVDNSILKEIKDIYLK